MIKKLWNYLKVIIKEEKAKVIDPTPIASTLKGSFKAPKDFDYKKELIDYRQSLKN